jgi:hypothetical protein
MSPDLDRKNWYRLREEGRQPCFISGRPDGTSCQRDCSDRRQWSVDNDDGFVIRTPNSWPLTGPNANEFRTAEHWRQVDCRDPEGFLLIEVFRSRGRKLKAEG